MGRDKRGPSRRGIAIGPLDFSAAKMAAFPVSDCGRDHLAGAAALVAAGVGRALRASEPSGRAARGDWAATSAAPPAFRIFRSFRIFRNFRRFRSFRDFRIFRNFRRFRSFRIFRIFRIIRPLPHQHAQALPSARRLRPSARRFPPQAQRGGCADRCDSRAVRRSCAPGCRPV